MSKTAGRHFLQIPGPSNVPDRVLRAMDMPTMDHRGPEFVHLTHAVVDGMKKVFQNRGRRCHLPGLRDWCLGSRPGQYLVRW